VSGSSGSPLFDENSRIIGQLRGGGSYCDETGQYDYYGKISTSMLDYNFRLALDPANKNPTIHDSYTPHLDDPQTIDCNVAIEFADIENEDFFLNGKNTIVYMSAGDHLHLESTSGKIWDLSCFKKTKFDISPNNGCNADDGTAYLESHTSFLGMKCTAYYAELDVELIEYDYYLDLPSENVLVDGPIRIGRVFWMDDLGLFFVNMSDCGSGTRLQVKEFYLDKYLPVSLKTNKVYSLTIKTCTDHGSREKRVWLDTYNLSLLSISGETIENEISRITFSSASGLQNMLI
jgi:hypothetical protein